MENKPFDPLTARSLAEQIYYLSRNNNTSMGTDVKLSQITHILETHIRKPSDDDKSIPAKCEEAYNEAIKLLTTGRLMMPDDFQDTSKWSRDVLDFLNKPNPFKESDIVKKDEREPILLPFSLEEAKNGAKVVTRELNDVKIVADDLTGNYPILAVVSTGIVKISCMYTIGGSTESQHPPYGLIHPERAGDG